MTCALTLAAAAPRVAATASPLAAASSSRRRRLGATTTDAAAAAVRRRRPARRRAAAAAAAAASDDDDSHYYSGDARGPNAVEDVVELYLARARATAADSDPSSIVDPDDDGPPRGRGKGRVYLIGTGPGDPGLLTLKAFHLMQTADVVLYDRLVAPAILDMVHADARMLYVGKQAGFHTRTQDEIEAMLLGFAEVGATVVRLKGGDPLVFGRGGEEMEALMARGHALSIVPGVTAAAGVGSELGIPLTHRGAATSVRLLTGHLREGAAKEAASGEGNAVADPIDFAVTAADLDTTLVVYMGLGTLPSLAGKVRSIHWFPYDRVGVVNADP